MFAVGARFSWLGKHGIFRKPFGPLMRRIGGIPVDRDAPAGVVKQILHQFETLDSILLGLAPEGTRSAVSRWRTGFWRIARRAQVPIVPVYFDYGNRVVGFTKAFDASDDMEADIASLQERYRNITPRKKTS